ncbi:MAG TPA: DUF6772 family protein [Acidimicrobiales bacterium]|jgi:hypothetical protein|nr:DUF6772 family protein [Acidimicrobiales bacterium]
MTFEVEGVKMRARWAYDNVKLERFNPLGRILSFDDFDEGVNGWAELLGNYDGTSNLDTVARHMRDFRPPQLSTCTFFDIGTHGPMSGSYALKLATRPVAGHTATAIKRLTMVQRGRVQFETYFTYSAEAAVPGSRAGDDGWDANAHPSEREFGCFTLGSDLADTDGVRYHCVMRYMNTDLDGNLEQRWRYPVVVEPTPKEILESGDELDPLADFTAPNPHDWRALDAAPQPLCYNELPTKVNWHYLRWTIDTGRRANVELQLNDRVYDLHHVPVPSYVQRYEALDGLLNLYVTVRTHTATRNFLWLDAAVISVDW